MSKMKYRVALTLGYFITSHDIEFEKWLTENVGKADEFWKISFYEMKGGVSFLNEEDMMAFKLMYPEYCE